MRLAWNTNQNRKQICCSCMRACDHTLVRKCSFFVLSSDRDSHTRRPVQWHKTWVESQMWVSCPSNSPNTFCKHGIRHDTISQALVSLLRCHRTRYRKQLCIYVSSPRPNSCAISGNTTLSSHLCDRKNNCRKVQCRRKLWIGNLS